MREILKNLRDGAILIEVTEEIANKSTKVSNVLFAIISSIKDVSENKDEFLKMELLQVEKFILCSRKIHKTLIPYKRNNNFLDSLV